MPGQIPARLVCLFSQKVEHGGYFSQVQRETERAVFLRWEMACPGSFPRRRCFPTPWWIILPAFSELFFVLIWSHFGDKHAPVSSTMAPFWRHIGLSTTLRRKKMSPK